MSAIIVQNSVFKLKRFLNVAQYSACQYGQQRKFILYSPCEDFYSLGTARGGSVSSTANISPYSFIPLIISSRISSDNLLLEVNNINESLIKDPVISGEKPHRTALSVDYVAPIGYR